MCIRDSHTAGGTFAAGFIHGKLQEELGDIHHAGGLVHDDQAAGAHHGADCDQIIVVDRGIYQLRRDTACLLYTSRCV